MALHLVEGAPRKYGGVLESVDSEIVTRRGIKHALTEPKFDEETAPRRPTAVEHNTGTRVVPGGRTWRVRYSRILLLSDLVALSAVVFGTQLAWFGVGATHVSTRNDSQLGQFPYWLFSTGLVLVWVLALSLVDSRTDRVIGTGATEYIRVASASIRLFGVLAILAFLLRVDVARGYLLISLPLGIAVLLLERWAWRHWLNIRRLRGQYSARVLLVGSSSSVAQIHKALRRSPRAGYSVVGACLPGGKPGDTVPGSGLPVLGDVDAVSAAMATSGADTVAITSTDELPPSNVKRISWELEAGQQHLVLAPSIVDVVGPRIHTRPVAGLPLIHVETPRYSRGQRVVKRAADIVFGSVGLLLALPLMVAIGIGIRLSTGESAIFAQTRLGLDGRRFRMLKFRTMVSDAEARLGDLLGTRDAGNEVLFKMLDDPRVTPFGRLLRRFSLDELPQLANVIAGRMSLVGPRPPLPHEVERYDDHVHRRFIVKPGLTGLWQVSGRSTLSWDESVRLDLSYVENWTLLGDLVIMFRTARAVLAPGDTTA